MNLFVCLWNIGSAIDTQCDHFEDTNTSKAAKSSALRDNNNSLVGLPNPRLTVPSIPLARALNQREKTRAI